MKLGLFTLWTDLRSSNARLVLEGSSLPSGGSGRAAAVTPAEVEPRASEARGRVARTMSSPRRATPATRRPS